MYVHLAGLALDMLDDGREGGKLSTPVVQLCERTYVRRLPTKLLTLDEYLIQEEKIRKAPKSSTDIKSIKVIIISSIHFRLISEKENCQAFILLH